MSKTCSLSSSWIRPRRQPAASSERAPSRRSWNPSPARAAGARTGLSNIVIGIAFVACAFLAPVIGMVTSSATCGALVVVGYLMMTEIGEIDWSDIASAFPAFLTIVGIPMTYSIANGIGLGFISYCIIKVAQGEFRDVKPLMWVAALAFLASFIFA